MCSFARDAFNESDSLNTFQTDGLSVKSTRITFTAPFSAARIGSYSCSVTYVFGSSGTSEMTRRYDVKIVNIPTADVSNPTEVIVVTGSTAHVACRFHRKFTGKLLFSR